MPRMDGGKGRGRGRAGGARRAPSPARPSRSGLAGPVVRLAVAALLTVTLVGAGIAVSARDGSLVAGEAAGVIDGGRLRARPASGPASEPVVPGVLFSERIPTVAELTRKYAAQGLTLLEGDPTKPTTFTISSFNVLGSSHTLRRRGWAQGPTRAARSGALLRGKGVSVVGLQEFQTNQIGPFLSAVGGFEAYPGTSLGALAADNSIAWDPEVWQLVEGHTVGIPYFFRQVRQMPYVLLRHRGTGRLAWFSNFHNPADVFGCKCAGNRVAATNREIALVRELTADGTPMFTTGDMNDRGGYACRFATSGMHSADGVRSSGGACHLVGSLWIDWIWGSAPVSFDDYQRDFTSLNSRMSDHPVVTAKATIAPASDNGACRKHVRDGRAYYFCPDPTAR